ncbi:MAG: Crp/Fnr family transcriptional regulator [Nitrospinae bacterium]|nr:Crp/Fnr family transcriptional regulator [Nitrospinota bacterium]
MDLSVISVFRGVRPQDLKKIEAMAQERAFEKGDPLFLEGDAPDNVWFILEGEVKVFKEYASGKSAIIGIYGKGEAVAMVAVIDGKSYPASCQAVMKGSAAVLRRQDALNVITTNPVIALEVMKDLSGKLRAVTSQLGSMSVQSVIRRLSTFLLGLAAQVGVKDARGVHVDLFLTRKELAECIGTSFEVAVRCLGKLKEEGVLEVEGKRLVIFDMKKLEKIAEPSE